MKHIPDIEQKLEKTLNSLDGIRRAGPTPYFYTRLKARLARDERGWSGIASLISRPVYAVAMVCIVLLVNTWIVVNDRPDTSPVNSVQSTIDQLPDEYNVAVATFYDYETP